MTFETTLHNLGVEKAKLLQENAVNRLSVGIQTFSNRGWDWSSLEERHRFHKRRK